MELDQAARGPEPDCKTSQRLSAPHRRDCLRARRLPPRPLPHQRPPPRPHHFDADDGLRTRCGPRAFRRPRALDRLRTRNAIPALHRLSLLRRPASRRVSAWRVRLGGVGDCSTRTRFDAAGRGPLRRVCVGFGSSLARSTSPLAEVDVMGVGICDPDPIPERESVRPWA